MRMLANRLRSIEAKGTLTPMIDVTFLLLVFFMVTSKFKANEGRIEAFLPKDQGTRTTPTRELDTPLRLRLRTVRDAGGAREHERIVVRFGRRDVGEARYQADTCPIAGCATPHGTPDFHALEALLREARATARAGTGRPPAVVVDASPDVPFTYVVSALDTCVTAGLPEVRFAASARDF